MLLDEQCSRAFAVTAEITFVLLRGIDIYVIPLSARIGPNWNEGPSNSFSKPMGWPMMVPIETG